MGVKSAETAGPAEVLVSAAMLTERISELATELTSDYGGTVQPPLLVGVLKGCCLFLADLVRALAIDVATDFMSISSYADRGSQSGVVRIVKDLEQDIAGRDVLIVEDIVDTGLTLTYLRRTLTERRPATLRTITLLDKTARRLVPVPVEYRGFEIPDVFVVGYGMDFQSKYRNFPDILAIRDVARLANDPLLLLDRFATNAG